MVEERLVTHFAVQLPLKNVRAQPLARRQPRTVVATQHRQIAPRLLDLPPTEGAGGIGQRRVLRVDSLRLEDAQPGELLGILPDTRHELALEELVNALRAPPARRQQNQRGEE